MMTDSLADMLTRIRNASRVGKKEVELPHSNLKQAVAEILAREGYLEKVAVIKSARPSLLLTLKYFEGVPAVHHLKRVSTPGHRRYVKARALGRVLNGLGIMILSTPRGVMTNVDAAKAKVGGEVICEIY